MKFLEYLDLLHFQPHFLFKKKFSYKTKIGGLATIIGGVLGLFFIIVTYTKYFNNYYPEIYIQELHGKETPKLNINEFPFKFLIGIEDSLGMLISMNNLLLLDAKIIHSKDNLIIKEIPINLKDCSESDLIKEPRLPSNSFNLTFCVSNSTNFLLEEDSYLYDFPKENKKSELVISFKKCQGTDNCLSENQIAASLKQSSVFLIYKDINLIEDPETSFQGTISKIKTSLMSQLAKNIRVKLAQLVSRRFQSVLGLTKSAVETHEITAKSPEIDIYEPENGEVARIVLEMTTYKTIYTQFYSSRILIISELGGYFMILLLLIYLITFPLINRQFLFDLSNEIDHKQKFLSGFLKEDMQGAERLSDIHFFDLDPLAKSNKRMLSRNKGKKSSECSVSSSDFRNRYIMKSFNPSKEDIQEISPSSPGANMQPEIIVNENQLNSPHFDKERIEQFKCQKSQGILQFPLSNNVANQQSQYINNQNSSGESESM